MNVAGSIVFAIFLIFAAAIFILSRKFARRIGAHDDETQNDG